MSLSDDARRAIVQRAERALLSVSVAFVADLKKKVSVPAPRRQTPSGRYVATTPATPGAPPRVVTGAGRGSISLDLQVRDGQVIIRVGMFYMLIHEAKDHQWIQPTWDENVTRYKQLFMRVWNGN